MNKEVLEYINNIPAERTERFLSIHEAIISVFPNIEINMLYKMPTYRYKEGWIALANQKSYISFYTCSAEHIEPFKEKYPNIKTGKGCINFRNNDKIPITELKKVIKHAIDKPKSH